MSMSFCLHVSVTLLGSPSRRRAPCRRVCARIGAEKKKRCPPHLPPRVTDTSPSASLWILRSRREEGGGLPRFDTQRSETTSTTPEVNKESLEIIKMSPDSLEEIKTSIAFYKTKHDELIQEQRDTVADRDAQLDMAQKFRQRSKKLLRDLIEGHCSNEEQIGIEKAKVIEMKRTESELTEEIWRVQEALKRQEADIEQQQQQADVFTAAPERPVVFTGSTGSADLAAGAFAMAPRVVYPMEGGSVLVTFEEEVVANKILDIRTHRVSLGPDCRISMEARPVRLMLPSLVEIDTEVSPWHILVSELPAMDTDTLLSKLEIHFSKQRHGGGEVERCELLPDAHSVVIAFLDDRVAKRLTEKEHHEVALPHKKHKVRVTPFFNGKVTNLETKMTVCRRTVLLTGIPDVMEAEVLQDLLEIHFQKGGNGGGEVDHFLYNPPGRRASAVFGGADFKEE
ncbi:interferon-induced protein 35 isoform X2 [Pseudoliparis swirei]|uniref:interferon-induced protein 35 isoform X2 n=1 Tax=Pseudoliparis swirei TaxID=2059687 RepID=UPI0024BD75F5|nr:interferon-induced protein 35 isoform X2 [Pseudoliparis swirei]